MSELREQIKDKAREEYENRCFKPCDDCKYKIFLIPDECKIEFLLDLIADKMIELEEVKEENNARSYDDDFNG